MVGHADTGRLLRLTETATEVVETDPATFAFSLAHASRTVLAVRPVRAYAAGRAPWSAFVNGTPERRTGSNSEWFAVSPPHYRERPGPRPSPTASTAADGVPCPPSGSSTPACSAWAGTASVRTADAAGAIVRSFHWRVVPLPAPAACVPGGAAPAGIRRTSTAPAGRCAGTGRSAG